MPKRKSLLYHFNRFLERHMPAGLYQRSLIILVAPMVLLQSIMTGVILDRHWDNVARVLGRSLSREIGLTIQLYETSDKSEASLRKIEELVNRTLRLGLTVEHGDRLPPPVSPPLFPIVNTRLVRFLTDDIGRPFWIDNSSQAGLVDIRVQVEKGLIFRLLTNEDRAYASGTDVLLFWMILSSLVLLSIAAYVLRKQISPILDLAEAAQSFGTGRDTGNFRPRGAAEVRAAGLAFLDMRDRIARHVDQRTAMLAGVSHDLRTILTRFKLELAFLGEGPKVQPLKEDVEEMQRMLEAYMAFVRGDGGETIVEIPLADPIGAAARVAARDPQQVKVEMAEGLRARVKPNAFRRLLGNIIGNAARHGKHVKVGANIAGGLLTVTVDDDGPGIPEAQRADAFRPFVRLDNARNLDETGTGLGLAIALDIARAHGGDLKLEDSTMGGLRAVVQIPV